MKTTKRFFYGVSYKSGRSTTTGSPNKKTGRMNIAIDAKAFKTKKERDNSGLEKVTRKELRTLCLGDSLSEFKEYVEMIQFEAEIK